MGEGKVSKVRKVGKVRQFSSVRHITFLTYYTYNTYRTFIFSSSCLAMRQCIEDSIDELRTLSGSVLFCDFDGLIHDDRRRDIRGVEKLVCSDEQNTARDAIHTLPWPLWCMGLNGVLDELLIGDDTGHQYATEITIDSSISSQFRKIPRKRCIRIGLPSLHFKDRLHSTYSSKTAASRHARSVKCKMKSEKWHTATLSALQLSLHDLLGLDTRNIFQSLAALVLRLGWTSEGGRGEVREPLHFALQVHGVPAASSILT